MSSKPKGVIGDKELSPIMIYNALRHTLEKENGEIVATFNSSIRADECFTFADMISNFESLKKELEDAEETIECYKVELREYTS